MRSSFKKVRNTNSGCGRRGIVHIDITAPNEKLADMLERMLIEEGFQTGQYGDDLGDDGYLFSMFIPSNELKDFNYLYNKFKKELLSL